MKSTLTLNDDDRGQVGIGTLIVFIAMVLVAAIAAGVLINTAGFLQTKSEATGQDSTSQVSNRVTVVSGFGNVDTSTETVESVNLTVMRGAGSNDINLSKATIEWIGPNEAKTLSENTTATGTEFAVSQVKDTDNSVPVLNSQDDRLSIDFDVNAIESGNLSPGTTVELRITTQYGAVTFHTIDVPPSLSDKSAVSV